MPFAPSVVISSVPSGHKSSVSEPALVVASVVPVSPCEPLLVGPALVVVSIAVVIIESVSVSPSVSVSLSEVSVPVVLAPTTSSPQPGASVNASPRVDTSPIRHVFLVMYE